MLLLLTESVYANTTVVSATTTFPSGIRPPPDASMSPSEDKSDWDKYGLPIVLLLVVLFVFGAINWAVFVLPETTCWKKLTNYKQLEEEDTSPLGYTMKRRVSGLRYEHTPRSTYYDQVITLAKYKTEKEHEDSIPIKYLPMNIFYY